MKYALILLISVNAYGFLYNDKVSFKDPFYGDCVGNIIYKWDDHSYRVEGKCSTGAEGVFTVQEKQMKKVK